MKKTMAILLVLILCLSSVAALADTYGLYALTDVSKATDAYTQDGENYDGAYQVNSTICAVVLGDDGVIKSVKFDVVQSKVGFTLEGKCTTEAGTEVTSKVVLGDAYGMAARATAGEWYQQAAAFEAYCVGKTVAEVAATPLYARDESHTACADVAELKTTCTIDVGEFITALQKAAELAK